MLPELRNKIIDDLLLKNPKGPTGKPDPEPASEVVQHYGYEKEVLFDLQIHSYVDAVQYVRHRFFSGIANKDLGRKKATVTRRSKRVWSRVDPAVRAVKREGSHGVYKVLESRWSYSGSMGFLHANNQEDAQNLADMFFGYVMTSSYSSGKPFVEIVERGGPENLMKYNQEIIDKLTTTISGIEKDIENKTKNLQTLKARLDIVKALQEGQTKNKSS